MHHIYHTEGLILGSRNYGETGKYYYIFTRELGMIYASAQGVRKMSSKLRFVLQDFSYLKIDLVQGKDFWRITSASKTNKLDDLLRNRLRFRVVGNICRLLKRLLVGVEPNSLLFDDILAGLLHIEKKEDKEELENLEVIVVLRILNNLGYIGRDKELDGFLNSSFQEGIWDQAGRQRKQILREINKALKETQL